MKILNLVYTVALSALLLGCTVGPDYQKPETELPQNWTATQDASVQNSKDAIQAEWWKNFHDPVLDQLIQKAVSGNLDLKAAEARIAEARGSRASAASQLLPQGDVMGSATREANEFAVPGNFPGITKPFNIFQTGFDASWELDLFGGHRREVEAANAQLQATEATRDDAVISLMAEVARTYVDIRQSQQQLALAQDIIKSDESTLRIAQQRYNVGDTAGIDVTQAQAQLEQVQSQLPFYRNMQAQAEYSMDVLIGEQPGAAHKMMGAVTPIPLSDKKLILAAPASVIANRPDILTAERNLAAATAQQGVAVAQFFPDISLTGFIGLLNTHADNLIESTSKSWLMGSKVVWPILSYGKLSANLDTANAQQQEVLASYQKTIIEALSDVERSVTAYTEQQKFEEALARSVAHNKHAYQISQERYKEGLTSFLEVLDAERTLYSSQNQLADAQAKTTQDLIAAYKSLGGGWKNPTTHE
jgi:NodT family efflux transporter outer membrane factor (OMF) lipoprotein